MAGRRILWGILLAGALGLYLFANSAGTLCVLLAAALPLLSAVSLLLPRQITLTLSAPETVGRGEQMTCTLTVSSSGIPAQFELAVEAENGFTGELSTQVIPLFVKKGPVSLSWQLAETHSGIIRLSCSYVREFDSFGLFSRKRTCAAQAEITLRPQTFPVSVCLNQAAEVLLDSEIYSTQKAGNDPGETFRIREYVPGDPIRQIHWKLSEKTGTLMVREFGLPAMNRLLLVFLPDKSLLSEQLDTMLDTMVSISSELLRQELPHTLLYAGELHEIADMPTLVQTVNALLRSAPELESTTAFLQTHPALSYAHIVLIAANAVPMAENFAQTGCVSVLFPGTGTMLEDSDADRIRIYAFHADALRSGMLHFEL